MIQIIIEEKLHPNPDLSILFLPLCNQLLHCLFPMFTFIHLLSAWRTVRCLCPCPRPLATSWWASPPEPLGKGPFSRLLSYNRNREVHCASLIRDKFLSEKGGLWIRLRIKFGLLGPFLMRFRKTKSVKSSCFLVLNVSFEGWLHVFHIGPPVHG